MLCRGVNDGDELRRTLTDLLALRPQVGSIAAVPAGVTDYRKGLYKLTPYDKESPPLPRWIFWKNLQRNAAPSMAAASSTPAMSGI